MYFMKTMKKYIITAGVMAASLSSLSAFSQHTASGYFLENYTYGYQLNPAFGNEKNFVSFPGIGNLNVAFRGSLHLTDVLYNRGGKTVLFTNPQVSAAEVMKNIGDKNKIASNDKIDILSGGFKAFGGYNTVSISAVANVEANIPGSFFSLAKEGIYNRSYDIKDMRARANAYAQIAFNHSRDIKQVPGLRVGAAVKFLVGVGQLDFRFNEAELNLGQDAWNVRANADVYASLKNFRFKTKTYEPEGNQGMQPYDYVSGGKLDKFGITGFGMAFDLGAEYKWRDFTFSLAALDLGFINWGKTKWASTDGTRTFQTDKYIFSPDDDADNSFKEEFRNVKDDLSKIYQLQDMGEKSSMTNALAATLNIGVKYELPYYRRLSFGLLNTTRISGPFTWTNFRLSANVAPVKIFSANVNVGVGTYGADFGWMLNLHTTGFNLFLGMDHTLGKLAKQGVPLNSNASFNFGIDFPF